MKTLVLIVACALLVCSPAIAEELNGAKQVATPQAINFDVGKAVPWSNNTIQTGLKVYECLVAGSTYQPQDDVPPSGLGTFGEYADDVHTTMGGVLTCLTIGYFQPAGLGAVSAVITLYGNDPADGVLNAPVAGPYAVANLPEGFNVVTLTVPDAPLIPVDMWFGVEFTPATAGLVIAGAPPSIGVSHDLFIDVDPLGGIFFGGSPLANFMLDVQVEDVTVGVEATTWSTVKGLYRDN